MKKIYLVVNHSVYDYSDNGIGTMAFSTREKAESFFKTKVEEVKREIEGLYWDIITDTADEFEAYEEGYYAQNHTFFEIRELVIE